MAPTATSLQCICRGVWNRRGFPRTVLASPHSSCTRGCGVYVYLPQGFHCDTQLLVYKFICQARAGRLHLSLFPKPHGHSSCSVCRLWSQALGVRSCSPPFSFTRCFSTYHIVAQGPGDRGDQSMAQELSWRTEVACCAKYSGQASLGPRRSSLNGLGVDPSWSGDCP